MPNSRECPESIPTAKRRLIVEALKATGGDKTAAAGMLQIGRTTLYRKVREFEIGTEEWATWRPAFSRQ